MDICKRVVFRGHVQGVGFRMTTQRIARRHMVAGFVRNLLTGEVELVAQGKADEVQRFIGEVSVRMADNIRDVEIGDLPAGDFVVFDIRE